MKQQPEYTEGKKARENFEQGMIALFKVPKESVATAKKRGKVVSPRKPKKADRG
jgi:hypothetical protein